MISQDHYHFFGNQPLLLVYQFAKGEVFPFQPLEAVSIIFLVTIVQDNLCLWHGLINSLFQKVINRNQDHGGDAANNSLVTYLLYRFQGGTLKLILETPSIVDLCLPLIKLIKNTIESFFTVIIYRFKAKLKHLMALILKFTLLRSQNFVVK